MTTALARTDTPTYSLNETLQLGATLAKSGYFQDARDASQAVAKILAGAELGIGPLASLTGIFIVKNRVTLSANLMAALVKRSGKYNYRVTRMDDQGCVIDFYEGAEKIGTSSFTDVEAKNAGLASGDNWRKFPRNMFFARAMSNGVKWFCPDLAAGPIYTPDELTNNVRYDDAGDVVEVGDVAPVAQPKALVAPNPIDPKRPDAGEGARALRLIERINDLWDEEVALGGEPPVDELQTNLSKLPYAELVRMGKRVANRVDVLKVKATNEPSFLDTEADEGEAFVEVEEAIA